MSLVKSEIKPYQDFPKDNWSGHRVKQAVESMGYKSYTAEWKRNVSRKHASTMQTFYSPASKPPKNP